MKLSSIAAIYILFWTICLFMVLPFGVRTDEEAGQDRKIGHADSAPNDPMLWRKVGYTTLLSAVLFAIFYANYSNGWLMPGDIPFLNPPPEAEMVAKLDQP